MEAAFVNTLGPGDVAVVAVNGLFGERMVDVASRCGAEVVRVDHEWGQPVDADRVLGAHGAYAATVRRIGLMSANAAPGKVALVLAALQRVRDR